MTCFFRSLINQRAQRGKPSRELPSLLDVMLPLRHRYQRHVPHGSRQLDLVGQDGYSPEHILGGVQSRFVLQFRKNSHAQKTCGGQGGPAPAWQRRGPTSRPRLWQRGHPRTHKNPQLTPPQRLQGVALTMPVYTAASGPRAAPKAFEYAPTCCSL